MFAVAEIAGVNNTLVEHHFGNRDALIEAALDWSVRQSIGLSGLENLPSDEDDFCRSLIALIRENPDMQTFQFEMIQGRGGVQNSRARSAICTKAT